jgi:excisionase family DNA binding protein
MNAEDLKLFTMGETAGLLRVHRTTVSRLVQSGELACCSIGTRKLIRAQDLARFIESRIGVVTASESPKET